MWDHFAAGATVLSMMILHVLGFAWVYRKYCVSNLIHRHIFIEIIFSKFDEEILLTSKWIFAVRFEFFKMVSRL